EPSLARDCKAMKFGMAIAARMPMITTTIISSIRVKPFLLRSMGWSPYLCFWTRVPDDPFAGFDPDRAGPMPSWRVEISMRQMNGETRLSGGDERRGVKASGRSRPLLVRFADEN